MAKFIKISDKKKKRYYINVNHIIMVKDDNHASEVFINIPNEINNIEKIDCPKNYAEIMELIVSAPEV